MKYVFLLTFFTSLLFGTPFDGYFEGAAHTFGLDSTLLKRIATIESSMNPNAINLNKNGTKDYGLMQINSMHIKRLASIGVTSKTLMDPEVNIYIGAMILSSHIHKSGYNLEAIGCYHSTNPIYKNQWLKRLAMATIPSKDQNTKSLAIDPRTAFAKAELSRRTNEKIAKGSDPKKAWREARAEVSYLMGNTSEQ